ncbi:MAG TPA: tRNA (adenosine(37)-N6)-dimethylallyltransferase MiaA [Lapillicoccus sp.]|nr:tRNA (adenosine(37)-N6)-dimethylallyltransferase MiaA [Lapillicoccus sp.]
MSESPRSAVVAVVGPTATGKSELGLALAERLDGEVVNADAMQLYRGMDIGTAKLSPDQRRGIVHHQLDVLEVREEASVAAYQRHARADIAGIGARGRIAVLVGGSGLYVRAALDRLDIPPTDRTVRARLDAELADVGVDVLRARLVRLDPAAADAIEPRNGRRVVRALEVVELTGRPFSASLPTREHLVPTMMLGLAADRSLLDARINQRVRGMWRQGLVDEVKSLVPQGLRDGRTASKALGYSQALAHMDGRMTPEEAQEATATATRRYARRQVSWFHADPRVVWLPHDAPDLVDRALAAVGTAGRMRA